ncbi:hypothetical protein [Kitasatospora purpeofusca]|uniref:hypothetical protein n=1 Tax=Kitasatospora purpeofusca TaxID=67352 RepID=UPI00365A9D1A
MRIRTVLTNHAAPTPWPVDGIEHICPVWSYDRLYQRFIVGRPIDRASVIHRFMAIRPVNWHYSVGPTW